MPNQRINPASLYDSVGYGFSHATVARRLRSPVGVNYDGR